MLADNLIGLVLEIALDGVLFAGLQHLVTDTENIIGLKVARDTEHHIVEIIKSIVAVVEELGGDFGDRLYRSRDVYLNGMIAVHFFEHIEHNAPLGGIVVHTDFLTDNALLLRDCLLGKVRTLNEVEQDLEAFREFVGTAEQIAGLVKGGVGVRVCACLGVFEERVAVLALEHFVLKVVSDAVWNSPDLAAVERERVVDTAVARAENRVF